jgi:hypothetical protein
MWDLDSMACAHVFNYEPGKILALALSDNLLFMGTNSMCKIGVRRSRYLSYLTMSDCMVRCGISGHFA